MVNIRKFNIDFTAENILPDGSVTGYQGEHNATTLSIVPPDEMTNCEDIVAYKVAFELNNCRHTRSELLEKTSPVTVLLSSQITSSKEISVQLEGYGEDGNLLVKSPKVEKLIYEDSVGGVCVDFDGQSGTASDITANTLARHIHENAEVLNNLAENENGNLTYKGEEIKGGGGSGERPTAEWVITDADASAVEGSICTIGKYELPEGVDAGAEIKDILFPNSEGNYISIRNLASEDRIPYIPLFDKIYYDDYAGAYMVCVLGMIDSTPNWVMNNVNNYVQMSIKVIYYTD